LWLPKPVASTSKHALLKNSKSWHQNPVCRFYLVLHLGISLHWTLMSIMIHGKNMGWRFFFYVLVPPITFSLAILFQNYNAWVYFDIESLDLSSFIAWIKKILIFLSLRILLFNRNFLLGLFVIWLWSRVHKQTGKSPTTSVKTQI
jgi:hypothetical protein